MTLLEAALDYANSGWYVLPVKPNSKAPATEHGINDATLDNNQIRKWWTENPHYNIGIATGKSNLVVIDLDPRNGFDMTTLNDWLAGNFTRTVSTPQNGVHLYYRDPGVDLKGKAGAGVDVQHGNKYVLAPPSRVDGVYTGHVFGVEELPAKILDKIKRPHYKPTNFVKIQDELDDRPGSQFNRTADWKAILEPHGWSFLYNDGDEGYWCRPGKSGEVSATTNYLGTGLMYVFTTSTEFESDKAYTPFSAYTILNYGGDYSEAARSLTDGTSLDYLSANHSGGSNGSRAAIVDYPNDYIDGLKPKSEYKFTPAFATEHFVGQYIDYGSSLTDAALEYHEAAALTLLALNSAPIRGNLAPYPEGLRTNLYVALVGQTTRSRKSTAQRICTDIAKHTQMGSVLANRMTTEGLIDALTRRGSLPALWTPDELGVTIAEMYQRSFIQGSEELYLTVYAGDTYTYRKASLKGEVQELVIHNPHFSILGATTAESLARSGMNALESGLLPRFAIVYPNDIPPTRPADEKPVTADEKRARLIEYLRRVQMHTQSTPIVSFTKDALHLLNDEEEKLVSTGSHTARLPAMLYKVAMLSAVGRLSSVVTVEDSRSAVSTVNRWKRGVTLLRPLLGRKGADIDFWRDVDFAVETLRNRGGHATRMEMARHLKRKTSDMNALRATLIEQGYLSVDVNQDGQEVWHVL